MWLFNVSALTQLMFVFASIQALFARSNHKLLIGDTSNYLNKVSNDADKFISLDLFCLENSAKEIHKL